MMTKLEIIAQWYSFFLISLAVIGIYANIKDGTFNKSEYLSSSLYIFGLLLYLNIFLSRWFG